MPEDLWRAGIALLPLAVLLVGLLRLGWSGVRAGLVALGVAIALAVAFFETPIGVIGTALWRAFALSLDVLYIIWPALILYQLAEAIGAIRSIGDAVAHLTEDHVLQLLIIGFAFSSFLQGVAGFGVPVAITAPLLIGLGFRPLEAAAVPLIGHSWAVTMGGMASSFLALRAVTGLPSLELATAIALFLGLASVATGFAIAHVHAGLRPFRRTFGAVLVLGVSMGATQLVLAYTGHWIVASFGAGMVGLMVSMGLARLVRRHGPGYFGLLPEWPPQYERAEAPRPAPSAHPEMPFRLAFLPYYTLVVVVGLATFVAPLRAFLERIVIRLAVPLATTGLGWRTDAATFAFAVFGHPGALLLYTALISTILFRIVGRPLPRWTVVWDGARALGVPTTITIMALVGVAIVMTYSGMTFLLARGVTRLVGPVFPFMSPFIGLLGTMITGSNTNSNVLFGPLQRDAARLLGMNPVLMAALQSAGGALGSMVAPAKVVLATATTGLAGREGQVMRITIRYALVLTAVLGIIGALLQLIWGEPVSARGSP